MGRYDSGNEWSHPGLGMAMRAPVLKQSRNVPDVKDSLKRLRICARKEGGACLRHQFGIWSGPAAVFLSVLRVASSSVMEIGEL